MVYLYESWVCGPAIHHRPLHVGMFGLGDMSVYGIETGSSGGTGVLGVLGEHHRMLDAVTVQGGRRVTTYRMGVTLYRMGVILYSMR